MTANELKLKFAHEYGYAEWPKTYEVDTETYGNVCQDLINNKVATQSVVHRSGNISFITISIGPNNGIMFHNVELLKGL